MSVTTATGNGRSVRSASSLSPVVRTSSLVKQYGETRALDNVNLNVEQGVVVGLIGPSGCGKTTLVRNLTGITGPTSGEVSVFGVDPKRFTTATRSRFGYMPQLPVLFPTLTVWGNLTFMSSVYGMSVRGRRARLMELLEFVDLANDRRKRLADCSGGMQRRLTLAATLVHRPELLFLDEPTAGVDPILRERFWEHFRRLRDSGTTIIVPTQYVSEAAACDQVAVMSSGRLLTVLPPGELRRFAFGGDVITALFDRGLDRADLQRVSAVAGVRSVVRTDTGLRLVVSDGHGDLPGVESALSGMGVTSAVYEEFEPTFEEMFVAIIERDRSARALEAAA